MKDLIAKLRKELADMGALSMVGDGWSVLDHHHAWFARITSIIDEIEAADITTKNEVRSELAAYPEATAILTAVQALRARALEYALGHATTSPNSLVGVDTIIKNATAIEAYLKGDESDG